MSIFDTAKNIDITAVSNAKTQQKVCSKKCAIERIGLKYAVIDTDAKNTPQFSLHVGALGKYYFAKQTNLD